MVEVWFSSRLYYPFGKGPGQHINRCLKNKKCENERPVTPPDPRPEGRGPRLFFDFLGRESTPDAKKGEKGPRVGSSGREFA